MAGWLAGQLRKAEEALESVDRTAKNLNRIQARDKEDGSPGVPQPRPKASPASKTTAKTAVRPKESPAKEETPTKAASKVTAAAPPRTSAAADTADATPEGKASTKKAQSPPADVADATTGKDTTAKTSPTAIKSTSPKSPPKKKPSADGAAASTKSTTADKPPSPPETKPDADEDVVPEPSEPETSTADVASEEPALDSPPPEPVAETAEPEATAESESAVSNDVAATSAAPTGDEAKSKVKDISADLEVARKITKAAPSSGQSKEARLARICETLTARLTEYKAENKQLEALLEAEREKMSGEAGAVSHLEDELALAQVAKSKAEASLQRTMDEYDDQLRVMSERLEAANQAAALAEGRMQALTEEVETLRAASDANEARLVTALRGEVAHMETLLVEERESHQATRVAAEQREADVAATLQQTGSSITAMQLQADEKAERLSATERKLADSDAEVERLASQLQELEARVRVEAQRSASEGANSSGAAALKEEMEALRTRCVAAEAGKEAAVIEVEKMRVEVDVTRREAVENATRNQAELEKRFREVTELLYQKQHQLEQLQAERAAGQLRLERELKNATDELVQAKSARKRADAAAVLMDDESLVPIESIGPYYQKLANHRHIGTTVVQGARFLDMTTSWLGRALRQNPIIRLLFFFYLMFIHLFLTILIHHLQARSLRDDATVGGLAVGDSAFESTGELVLPPITVVHKED